jgi:hypothetical protein
VSYSFFNIKEMSEKCQIPFDIPYILSDNNTKLNNLLNEGESFDYKCIHGYARMTNVTCIQGYLTPQPLCEPRRDKISFSKSMINLFFFVLFIENCITHPYWIKNGYVKYQNRRHGGHAEYSVILLNIIFMLFFSLSLY